MQYGSIGTPEKYFLKWQQGERDDSRFKLDTRSFMRSSTVVHGANAGQGLEPRRPAHHDQAGCASPPGAGHSAATAGDVSGHKSVVSCLGPGERAELVGRQSSPVCLSRPESIRRWGSLVRAKNRRIRCNPLSSNNQGRARKNILGVAIFTQSDRTLCRSFNVRG